MSYVDSSMMQQPTQEPAAPMDGQPANPLWLQAMQDVKTSPLSVYLGYQGFRGSNTIRRGGWDPSNKSRFRDNFNPRNLVKFKNDDHFNHDNFIAKAFYNSEKDSPGWLGKRFAGKDWAMRRGLLNSEGQARQMWSGGTLGRISAAGRSMGGSFDEGVAGNTTEFLSRTAPEMAGIGYGSGGELAMGQLMSARGAVSQRVMGAMSGRATMTPELEKFGMANRRDFMVGRAWSAEAKTNLEGGARGLWEKAAMRVGEKQVAKAAITEGVEEVGAVGVKKLGTTAVTGMAARLGGEWAIAQSADWFPPAAVVANTAMAAYTAYSLAKMGATLGKDLVINPMAAKAKEAFNSFKGGIDNAPFGRGYVDTEVAATSRARGVMAIQNSRLNARSVLGSEAGMLHSHFG